MESLPGLQAFILLIPHRETGTHLSCSSNCANHSKSKCRRLYLQATLVNLDLFWFLAALFDILLCLSFPRFRGHFLHFTRAYKAFIMKSLHPPDLARMQPKTCWRSRLACNSLSSLGCLKVQASSLPSPEITGIYHQAWLSLLISLLHLYLLMVHIRFSFRIS